MQDQNTKNKLAEAAELEQERNINLQRFYESFLFIHPSEHQKTIEIIFLAAKALIDETPELTTQALDMCQKFVFLLSSIGCHDQLIIEEHQRLSKIVSEY